jgi:hypothetical protein
LMQDLDPIMVDPAAGDFGYAVQCRDVVGSKDTPKVSQIDLRGRYVRRSPTAPPIA